MDNEIRTFVYRTGSAEALTRIAFRSLKKKFVTAVSSMFILVVIATTALNLPADAGAAETGEEIQQDAFRIEVNVAAAEENATADITGTPDITDNAQNGTYTDKSFRTADFREVQICDPEESEAELMLLSIDDEEDRNGFIPETGNDASSNESGFSSKTEEVSEKVKVLEKPADSPDKLVYRYNRDMILDLDAENLECLERIVEAEACDQDFYGKMLVANVVINRIYAGFADTVKGVVFQKLGGSVQFAPIKDGTYYSMTVSKDTKEAVARVLAGEDYSQGATYFFQRSTTSATKAAWFDNKLHRLFKYGTHEFYKEGR